MEYKKRKQIRLKDYDYSQMGAYFITICTKDKQKLFWCTDKVGARFARPLYDLSQNGIIIENQINLLA